MISPGLPYAPVARTIQCGRCGAAVAVQQLAPWVPCPHCGNQQPLPPALVAELQGYQQAVSQDVRRAAGHLEVAASYESSAEQLRTPWQHYAVGFGLMAGLPILVAIGGGVAYQMGLIRPADSPLISFAVMGAAMVGVLGYLVWHSVRGGGVRRQPIRAGTTTVACPNCGAAVGLAHGQALDRCPYCRGQLMPSPTVIQAGLDAARANARRAELERWRQERTLIASYQGFAISGLVVLFMALGPMVLMTGSSAAIFTIQMASGEEAYSPGIFGLWAACLALAAGLVLGARFTIARRRALRDASAALARQLGGAPLMSLSDTVRWLNSYWAGPYNNRYLGGSDFYGGAAGSADGYIVLAEFSGTEDRHRKPRAHLLVAAWLPGLSDGQGRLLSATAQAEQQRYALTQQGYEVEPTAGGLLLRADKRLVRRIRKEPAQMAELAVALMQATRLTRSLGGVPVGSVG